MFRLVVDFIIKLDTILCEWLFGAKSHREAQKIEWDVNGFDSEWKATVATQTPWMFYKRHYWTEFVMKNHLGFDKNIFMDKNGWTFFYLLCRLIGTQQNQPWSPERICCKSEIDRGYQARFCLDKDKQNWWI